MPVTQSFSKLSILGLSVLPVLALAACGDGWEARRYDGAPYTAEGTAGHGVEWVRANMMPAKETKTEAIMKKDEPVKAEIKAPAEAAHDDVPPPPPSAGDKVFTKHQSK